MNKRIYELAKQAGFSSWDLNPTKETDSDVADKLGNFAKLIILECADISFDHWTEHKGCSAHFSIREHFGVKE